MEHEIRGEPGLTSGLNDLEPEQELLIRQLGIR